MDIVDFHIHPYLDLRQYTNMYHDLTEIYDENIVCEKIVKDLRNAGITHACGSVIDRTVEKVPETFEYYRYLNRTALYLKKKLGDFYTPGFHIHPDFIWESLEEIEYMADRGVNLIGELIPYAHGGYSYRDKGLDSVLEAAAYYHMIVSFHSTDDDESEIMIKRHPNVVFVAAHPGDKGRFLRHLERMERFPNLYLDLSGTGLFRWGMLEYGVAHVGAERFLFGTDYPITNPYMYVQAVAYEQITEDEKEQIMSGNARRLLERGMES